MEVIEDGTADNVEELEELIEKTGGFADTFIKESYFGEYISELFNDSYDISGKVKCYIDYDRLEIDSKMSYIVVEIDGITYLTLC